MLENIINIVRWLLGYVPPESPEDLRVYIRRIVMSNVKIELDWKPSRAKDVIRQDIVVMTQDESQTSPVEHAVESVGPLQNRYIITVPEKTKVFVKIVAYDGTYYSKPMVNQFTVPDVTVPCPPVNDGWKILEVEPEEPCY